MKKLLFLLLFPVSVFSQTLQSVDFVAKGYYKVIVSDTLYSQHQNQKECLQQVTNLLINNISSHCEQPWIDVIGEFSETVTDSFNVINVESLTLRQVNWSFQNISSERKFSYQAEAYGDSVRFEYFHNADLIRSSTQIPFNGTVHDTLINPPNDSLQIWIYGYWDKWVEPFHEIVDIALLDTLGEDPAPDPEPEPDPEQPDTTAMGQDLILNKHVEPTNDDNATFSYNHSGGLLVIGVTGGPGNGSASPSVTYDGVSMTLENSEVFEDAYVAIFTLSGASTGSNTVVITDPPDGRVGSLVFSIDNATIRNIGVNSGTTATGSEDLTVTTTSVSGDLVIGFLRYRNSSGTVVFDETEELMDTSPTRMGASSTEATGTSTTLTAAMTDSGGGNEWVYMGVSFEEGAGGGETLELDKGTFNLSGKDLFTNLSTPLDKGTFSLTGRELNQNLSVPLNKGTFSQQGYALSFGLSIPVDKGTFSQTVYDLVFNRSVPLDKGSFTLDGKTLNLNLSVPIGKGTFDLTGYDLEFGGQNTLVMGSGSFLVDGKDLSFQFTHVLDKGSFSVDGKNVNFNTSIPLEKSNFNLDGKELSFSHVVPLDKGEFDLTGYQLLFDSVENIVLLSGKSLISDITGSSTISDITGSSTIRDITGDSTL